MVFGCFGKSGGGGAGESTFYMGYSAVHFRFSAISICKSSTLGNRIGKPVDDGACDSGGWFISNFIGFGIGGLGRLVGVKGLFYRIAGRSAAGIDGPTEYSLYPANVSAKLLPKDPQEVCRKIDTNFNLKFEIRNLNSNSKLKISNYLGCAIIDANDIGRNVLGNTTLLPNKLIEEIFKDNPMGQTNEQTPVTIVFEM